jgi:phage host-nuclease inhibitor protein Gam
MPSENPTSIAQIEAACRAYDSECSTLEALVADLNDDLAAVRAKHLSKVKRQANVVARREAEVTNLVDQAPELFVKPKTMIFHGTKVGYSKSAGKLTTDDVEFVVAQIQRRFPEKFEELVRHTHELNKDALKRLPTADLSKIGCRIEGAGETVVVARTAGELEKLVEKMIAGMVAAMVEPTA